MLAVRQDPQRARAERSLGCGPRQGRRPHVAAGTRGGELQPLSGSDTRQSDAGTGNDTGVVTITVTSLDEARHQADDFDAIISAGPKRSQCNFGHRNHLVRTFLDITAGRFAPTSADVAAMLDFAASCQGSLLIHCHRGESRSTAVAIGAWVQAGATTTEACDLLVAAMPAGRAPKPNPLLLQLVEHHLGASGLVLDVARRWPSAAALLPVATTRSW